MGIFFLKKMVRSRANVASGKRKRYSSRSVGRYRAKRVRTYKKKTYQRTYKRRGRTPRTNISSVRACTGAMNFILNHPFNETGFDPVNPIATSIAFISVDPGIGLPRDVELTHNVFDAQFPSATECRLLQSTVYQRYKSMYKWMRCTSITVKYIPAITQGAMPSSEDIEGVPVAYSEAISGFVTVDMTRDFLTYQNEFPLTSRGEKDAEGTHTSRSYSMYKPWRKTFKPSVHQQKLPNNDPVNCLLKDRISPWMEMDDYDQYGPTFSGNSLIVRMRLPTYAGKPYPEAEDPTYAYPPYGESVIIGRIQVYSNFEFKGLRY